MASLIVPPLDEEPWPTLGPQVCDFIEERAIFGPGPLKGEPARLSPEKRAIVYRAYEVRPRGHVLEGRRRFKRVGWSVRKGLAKCLAPDTQVLMADGSERAASEIRAGDMVVGYDANRQLVAAPVVAAQAQPPTRLLRVRTSNGRSLVVTAEHPFLTRGTRMIPGVPRRRRFPSCDPARDQQTWVTAEQLIVGDRLVVGVGWSGETEVDPQDAWCLGVIVGDGSPDGRFTTADPEVLSKLGLSFSVTRCSRYDYYLRGVRTLLRKHGLFGCNSRTKRVPAAVQTGTSAAAAAFLAGYFDADGWASYAARDGGKTHSEIAWGSVNRPLLEQCQTLLARLGINAQISRSDSTYLGQRHEAWNLAVRDTVQTAALAGMLLRYAVVPAKRDKLVQLESRTPGRVFADRDTDRVVAIEEAGWGPTVAVEVADVHTHVTGGVVTHNTELLAWIAYVELHPEGPVRFDGWDAQGEPVGRPVASPYIPLLSYNKDQVEELAYGALMVIVGEGPDGLMFDVGGDRIVRLDERGREDGKAVPLAGSPNARDGARTTFQGFDEPHRLYLPRLHEAHDTMTANLPKRPDADAWSLYVGTAGEIGQDSIQERLHLEAQGMATGKQKDPRFFYFHRDAGQTHQGDGVGHNLKTTRGRIAAIKEATGPDGEYGKGQFADIAEQWERPKANIPYLERVWLNLWVRSDRQAYDPARCKQLIRPDGFRRGAPVVAGFDGARFRDATAIVLTHLRTGQQKLWGLWERPAELGPDDEWEVPEDEVSESVDRMMRQFKVWRFNGDPPHWTETLGAWASKYPDVVEEWHTRLPTPMAYACKDYADALKAGELTFADDDHRAWGSPVQNETMIEAFLRHIGNAGKHPLNLWDDDGNQMWRLDKIHPERKFDACMAAILSRQAYIAALKKGANRPVRKSTRIRRIA